MDTQHTVKAWAAEFVGTFWLVLGGCGSAVLAAGFPQLGIGFAGVALAFGLTVLTGAYALGPISGGHFNPAVSIGLTVGGRFPAARRASWRIFGKSDECAEFESRPDLAEGRLARRLSRRRASSRAVGLDRRRACRSAGSGIGGSNSCA